MEEGKSIVIKPWSFKGQGPLYTRACEPLPHNIKPYDWLRSWRHYGTKWILFHGLLDIALGPSKRGGPNAKVGTKSNNCTAIGSWKYYVTMMGSWLPNTVGW